MKVPEEVMQVKSLGKALYLHNLLSEIFPKGIFPVTIENGKIYFHFHNYSIYPILLPGYTEFENLHSNLFHFLILILQFHHWLSDK